MSQKCLGGTAVRASDFWSSSGGFNCRLRHCQVTLVNSAFHPSRVGKSTTSLHRLGLMWGVFACVGWHVTLCGKWHPVVLWWVIRFFSRRHQAVVSFCLVCIHVSSFLARLFGFLCCVWLLGVLYQSVRDWLGRSYPKWPIMCRARR